MASIGNDKGGRKRILFVAGDGSRKTIRLGKCDKKTAEGVKLHVERLLNAKLSGQPVPRDTAGWLAEIDGTLHDRLARAGLVESRHVEARKTLGDLVAEFLAARAGVKPGTMTNLKQATGDFLARVEPTKAVEDFTEADAEQYYRDLLASGLALNTARRRAGRAKEMFTFAIRSRVITANPFVVVKVRTAGNKERQKYVSVETIQRVLDACPSPEWRLIVALCRFAGLRCPSEHLPLTWEDVLWDQGRFIVNSPKTGRREVPLFPELLPYFREAFEAAQDGAKFVINFNRNDDGQHNGQTTNWSTAFGRILKRAGVAKWPRLFHGLRASCQTDLAARMPLHVVCHYLGNSAAVAQEHYLSVTEDDYRSAAQIPAQYGAAQNRTEVHSMDKKEAVLSLGTAQYGSERAGKVTPRGSEHLDHSPEDSASRQSRGTQSGTLARILALVERLDADERAELLRILNGGAA